MGDLSYESQLVASAIQSRGVYRRVSQVGIDGSFFQSNEFNRYIFQVAKYLDRIGNPFEVSAYEAVIGDDPTLEKRDKRAYISQVHDYFAVESQNVEIGLEKLKAVYKERTLIDAVKNIAHSVKLNKDTEEIHNYLKMTMAKLDVGGVEFEMQDYYETFKDRNKERFAIAVGMDQRFKFHSQFEAFKFYWPKGIGAGTTTSITGPTFVGKSVVLSNLAYLAVHPENKLDTIFIAAENMLGQVGSRFDAIFLDTPYSSLFTKEYSDKQGDSDAEWFDARSKDKNWGKLLMVKVPAKKFDANTIRLILESAVDRGYDPKVLLIDSPDHQLPVDPQTQWHLNKGEVYYDNKEVAEEFGMVCFCTTPMKASAVKNQTPTNEDVAGSIDISRVVDNQLMFKVSKDDKTLGMSRLVVTKNRDEGIIDERDISFRFKKSMVLIPYEESFQDQQMVPDSPDLPMRNFGPVFAQEEE